MARIRTIKPEFPQSESMGRVCRESRLCFILLFTLADDAGRLRGSSRMLASLLYPYDNDAKKFIDKWISELHNEGCIVRYEIEGDQYIQINKWLQHQKIDRPSESKIPPFDESSRVLAKAPASTSAPKEASRTNTLDQGGYQGVDQGKECIKEASRFDDFWEAWPKSERKQDKAKCGEKWKAQKFDGIAETILSDIATKKLTQKWQSGFIEAPEVYLNSKRWEAGVTPDDAKPAQAVTVPSKPGIDPTLAALIKESTSGLVKPPSEEVRARLRELSGAKACT